MTLWYDLVMEPGDYSEFHTMHGKFAGIYLHSKGTGYRKRHYIFSNNDLISFNESAVRIWHMLSRFSECVNDDDAGLE